MNGILFAKDVGSQILFNVGSGKYFFKTIGNSGQKICASVKEVFSIFFFKKKISIQFIFS